MVISSLMAVFSIRFFFSIVSVAGFTKCCTIKHISSTFLFTVFSAGEKKLYVSYFCNDAFSRTFIRWIAIFDVIIFFRNTNSPKLYILLMLLGCSFFIACIFQQNAFNEHFFSCPHTQMMLTYVSFQ